MSDNPYLSLIQGLNSEDSPVNTAAPSPEDYAAELSLWTNAEFTFDMPPGLGIFETDSGFDQLAASNTLLTTRQDPVLGQHTSGQLPPPPSPQLERQQPPPPPPQSLQFLDLSSQDSRPLSLLERTRQRNPLTEEPKPELQDQVAAINSFHSLLAAFSAATSQAQQQQQQQSQPFAAIQPAIAPAPTAAPTTPTAAKVLRQSLPQYKSKTIKTVVPSIAPSPVSPTDNTADKIISSKNKNKDKGIEIAEEKKKKKDHPVSSVVDSTCKEEEEDDEVMAKAAAEEDKRRRNTAASARFRQKKKLREQTLEQTVREQTVRAEALEARIRELEMEARWLRGLLVEKDTRFMEATASLEEANKRVRLE